MVDLEVLNTKDYKKMKKMNVAIKSLRAAEFSAGINTDRDDRTKSQWEGFQETEGNEPNKQRTGRGEQGIY